MYRILRTLALYRIPEVKTESSRKTEEYWKPDATGKSGRILEEWKNIVNPTPRRGIKIFQTLYRLIIFVMGKEKGKLKFHTIIRVGFTIFFHSSLFLAGPVFAFDNMVLIGCTLADVTTLTRQPKSGRELALW